MPALPKEISDDPRYRAVSARRDEAARRARASRSAYRLLTAAFVVSTAVAAVGSGLALYGMQPPPEISAALHRWVADSTHRTPILFVVALALGAAAFAQHRLRAASFGKEWATQRGEAEAQRRERERLALKIGHERGPEALREAGREFGRFLDRQIEYHRASADRHRASSRSLGLAAAALAAIVAVAGGLAALNDGMVVVLVALVGVCAPALVAAVKSWSEATSDVQRAELHALTWDRLVAEQARMPEFTAAVEAGDLAAALGHAERVLEALERDTSEFRQIRTTTSAP